MKKTALVAAVLLFCSGLVFGLEVLKLYSFPYKALVLKAKTFRQMNVNTGDITTTVDTMDKWEFTYKGKKYKCDLLPIGAIYLQIEGENSRVITFDIDAYRYNNINRTLFWW